MTDKEQTFKLLGWALAVSLSISGYLLKQTVDKIDEMYTTMNAIDKRLSLLEERQKILMDAAVKNSYNNKEDNTPEVTALNTHYLLKPEDIKIHTNERVI